MDKFICYTVTNYSAFIGFNDTGFLLSSRVPGCECDDDSWFWLPVHLPSAVWVQWLWVQPPCCHHCHPMGSHTERPRLLVQHQDNQN